MSAETLELSGEKHSSREWEAAPGYLQPQPAQAELHHPALPGTETLPKHHWTGTGTRGHSSIINTQVSMNLGLSETSRELLQMGGSWAGTHWENTQSASGAVNSAERDTRGRDKFPWEQQQQPGSPVCVCKLCRMGTAPLLCQGLNPHTPLVQLLCDNSQHKCFPFPSPGKRNGSAWRHEQSPLPPSMMRQYQPAQQKS